MVKDKSGAFIAKVCPAIRLAFNQSINRPGTPAKTVPAGRRRMPMDAGAPQAVASWSPLCQRSSQWSRDSAPEPRRRTINPSVMASK